MRRAWIGLALLSASWLFGLSYYRDGNWVLWAALVAAGTVLLTGLDRRKPPRGELTAAAVLLVPAAVLAPWPYRAAVLLVLFGALLCLAPVPRRWPSRLGMAAVTAGIILIVQALAMLAYESITARSHELPRALAYVPYGIAKLIGIDAALDGSTIALSSMRRVHGLGATWELLLDPCTLCFLVGGISLLSLYGNGRTARKGALRSLAPWGALTLCVALWLPARVALLIGVFMHRVLRTDYDAPLALMNQFWSPWVHLILLLGPVLLVMWFIRLPAGPAACEPATGRTISRRSLGAAALALASVLLITVGLFREPSGPRKGGRVLVDEYHSTWERTDRPFDTDWYGQDSGYNYACIYDYCSRFYEMDRLNVPIDANSIGDCDVLIVKVPTSRYAPDEIAAMERFVGNGGGLMLVGEHTNVFNTGTHLNDIARRFGFRFRYDCLFDIDAVFLQLYRPPLVPHPIVQNMPPLDFAVSCSLEPRPHTGRAVIRAAGLRSLPSDYHASNYYPQVEDRAESRWGAFTQLWTAGRGAGRVAAFADSTIFSNFSTFEPGKAELMLGMIEWLNHRNARFNLRPLLVGFGLLLAAGAVALRLKWTVPGLLLLGGALFGWSMAVMTARAVNHKAYPLPQPDRPFIQAVIDRTICNAPLSTSGFISGESNGFGIFERWILRLGWFTARRRGDDALTGDLLVFLYPDREVARDFRRKVSEYVASGGRVLLLDSPTNAGSTANLLLHPFGLSVQHATPVSGVLAAPEGWPAVSADSACEVKGGEPLVRIDGTPVAATVKHGQGTVTVISFGSRFTDTRMGVTGDVIPDAELRSVFDLQFRLLRQIIPGPAQGPSAAAP